MQKCSFPEEKLHFLEFGAQRGEKKACPEI